MAREDDVAVLQRRIEAKRWVWIDRPTLIHGRALVAGQCSCGCQSWSGEAAEDRAAQLLETLPGPQVLLDRWTGKRIRRAAQSELDGTLKAFDDLKLEAEHVYLPRRCYQKQLEVIEARPKLKGLFGGARGGKTQQLAEELVDAFVELGGPGVALWWVAPQLADTMRAIRKLITGEAIRGGARSETRPALIPETLIVEYPESEEQIKRHKPIVLADGTLILLKYAGRGGSAGSKGKDGGNLQGDATPWIAVDEGAEIMNPAVWHTLIQRTTDAGGRLVTATTPKVGSPLKHLVYDEGDEIAANSEVYLTGYAHLSMLDNPWITPKDAQWTIDTLLREADGEELVKMGIYGQWIVPGARMWEHFSDDAHVVIGPWRDIERYRMDGRPLRNITPMAAGAFFSNTTSSLIRIGGQDFNERGHYTIIVQVGVPEGLDEGDPENWVWYIEDEVKKAGEPWTAANHLAKVAGKMRQQSASYFANMAIACDSTGAQDQPTESATGNLATTYTQADAFVRAGFDMRPCHRSAKGRPMNPEKRAQQAILHKLMRRADLGQDAPRYHAKEAGLPPSTRLLINKSRCPELIKGLKEQARNEKGALRKRSDTHDDRISDPVDGLLYVLWAVMSDAEYYPRQALPW